ncbi:hypothetical protein [Streptomyces sp. NPDC047718]|uniref:hypothetical protein n=1 Tax=Streptomyces sp. NPDC047718 TaxID=3155479 RepID=UPI003411BA50
MPNSLKCTGEEKNMTLDEIEEFVKAARAAAVPGDSNVSAVVSTSGKIKQIEVEVNSQASAPDPPPATRHPPPATRHHPKTKRPDFPHKRSQGKRGLRRQTAQVGGTPSSETGVPAAVVSAAGCRGAVTGAVGIGRPGR